MSFAENLGTGTLADGFTNFRGTSYLGSGACHVTVTTPVPEPSEWSLWLAGAGLATFMARRRSAPDLKV